MGPASSYIAALGSTALALALVMTPMRGDPDAGLRSPVCVIQADPHHKGTLLAGTATARLFRSRDGGNTWSQLSFPAELRSTLHAILIDPAKLNVYWVAVSSETPQFAGLFRSVDEGVTWQRVRGLEQKQVWALARWKVDAQVIAAGTEDGVYLTRNGGEGWTLPSLSGAVRPRPVVSLAFDPADANILYAGTPHLAWKTMDGGGTWHPIHRGMEEDSDIFSLDVDARRRSRLFAAACSGIYRSLDGGGSWLSLEHALGGAVRTYVVVGAPDRPNVVYAGTSLGLIVSRDSGANWYRLSAEATRSVAFDPGDPHRIFVATDEGVRRIDDGGAHVRLTAGALNRP
jgi:photosystem II stability/assembly factor-like uncharacterized protein